MKWRELKRNKALRHILERRAFFISCIRNFFKEKGFLEVETPYLQPFPNLDPNIEPLMADTYFLHTSPEYGMKKLLAAGFDAIFQICRVFRRERIDRLHLVEFTMLEWYKKNKDYRWLIEFSFELLRHLAERMGVDKLKFGSKEAKLEDYRIVSLEEEFLKRFGVSIGELDSVEKIVSLAKSLGVPFDGESWENTFNLIYLNVIEPDIARSSVPVFVVDYPASMSAMARLRRDRPFLCERVELVVCGVELMNGYSELTDPKEQKMRLLHEASKRTNDPERFVDEDFVDAVGQMGEAAGAALGVDRLFMLFEGVDDIRRTVFEL